MRTALAAFLVAVAAPASAAAQLAPPSEAPPAARRVCARYRVVQIPAGPAARCVAHRSDLLGVGAATGAPGSNSSASGGSHGESSAGGRPEARDGGSGPAEPATPDSRAGTQAVRSRAGAGGDGAPIAILVAAAVAAAVMIGAARRPLRRRLAGPRA